MEIKTKFKEELLEKTYKRRRNFLLRLTCASFCVLLVLVYLVTPVSKVENCKIKGNYYLSNNDIISIMGVSETTFLYNVDKDSSIEYLANHPLVKKVDLSLSLLSLNIEIEEISPSAQDDNFIYLKDGSIYNNCDYQNVLEQELLDNLPYILQSNEYYGSFNNDTRYILFEMALIFVTKFNTNLDYIDFVKKGNSSYFDFYIKIDEHSQNVFTEENGYVEFLFDASCVADYFKDDMLDKLISSFTSELEALINDSSLKSYGVEEKLLKNENEFVKTFYVYPEKANGNVTITHI